MKKTIALLLACLMLVGLLPVGAFAQETGDSAEEAAIRDQLLTQDVLPGDLDNIPFALPEGMLLPEGELQLPMAVGDTMLQENEYNNTFDYVNRVNHDQTGIGALDAYDLLDLFYFELTEKCTVTIAAVSPKDSLTIGLWSGIVNAEGEREILMRDNTGDYDKVNKMYGFVIEKELEPGSYYLGITDAHDGDNTYLFYIQKPCHDYVVKGAVTAPTCTAEGYTTYSCTCKQSTAKKDFVKELGHDFKATKVVAPTCTDAGYTVYTCSRCKVTENREPTSAAGHTYDAGQVVAPTCTKEGYTLYTCTVCKFAKKENLVDALGHTEAPVPGVAATCTEPGLTEGKKCTVCQEITQAQNVIPALGHDYDPATLLCTRCGDIHPDKPLTGNATRISGKDRHETAFRIADQLKTAWGVTKFDAIILASGANFPDALAGSYLSIQEKAPILLHRGMSSYPANLEYIQNNLAPNGIVYILGGSSAVDADMELMLRVNGIDSLRLKGADRFGTNLAILAKAGMPGNEILVSTGYNFADSLAASASGKPILLVKDSLTEDQKIFLNLYKYKGLKFTIIGGTAAVSQSLVNELANYGSIEARLSGKTREETSVLVAETFFPAPTGAMVAYSRDFPDGLCGGPLAHALGTPLLLVNAGTEGAARDFVKDNGITQGYVLGGTAAVSNLSGNLVFLP